jgi:hypothetical protein
MTHGRSWFRCDVQAPIKSIKARYERLGFAVSQTQQRGGKTMPDATISLEDRQAIYDTLARYVWSMDTGDIEGVVAMFTPDGVVKDVTGKRWDVAVGGVRGFATHFLTRPNRRGGQHHVQHLFVEQVDGGGYRVTSYWVSIK